ncbi:hypothetical protein [Paenibacillus cremeus]|uniref:BIG2 domain-containing protein n=1 Tax=Paenibacillus cremeus TaxID=2163881 RepID=A0A559KCX0_9BACL|nr:hypothetical protein [Paenibacillus cremeus]TVY09970.1 hypothetical protein FPZ49_11405 [Paenibacillus cremeus]
MSTNTNQFLVSVADVVLRDTVADAVVLKGKTLINSAFKQTLATTEQRGGANNGLLFVYQHDKKLEVSIEDAKFDETYLALNNGASIINSPQNFYVIDEVITLASGNGTLANTPVGSVYVQKADNSLVTVTPSGTSFSVAGGANTTVKVTYRYSTAVDTITIDAQSVPNGYELTLSAKVFQASGQTATMQIVIPNFRISGNFDLNLTANGISSSKLDGMALVNAADGAYAYVNMKPTGAGAVTYQAIAATPSAISVSAGTPTAQLTVYGIRGGVYANNVVTSGCTFVSSDVSKATVSAGGLITRVAAGTCTITTTHTASGLTDTSTVTVS